MFARLYTKSLSVRACVCVRCMHASKQASMCVCFTQSALYKATLLFCLLKQTHFLHLFHVWTCTHTFCSKHTQTHAQPAVGMQYLFEEHSYTCTFPLMWIQRFDFMAVTSLIFLAVCDLSCWDCEKQSWMAACGLIGLCEPDQRALEQSETDLMELMAWWSYVRQKHRC